MTTFKVVKNEAPRQYARYGDSYGETYYQFSQPVTRDEATDLLDDAYDGTIKHWQFPYRYKVLLAEDGKTDDPKRSTLVCLEVTQLYLD